MDALLLRRAADQASHSVFPCDTVGARRVQKTQGCPAKGMVKEVAGKLVGNKKLEEKGKVEKIRGQAQAEVGDVKQAVKDAKKGA